MIITLVSIVSQANASEFTLAWVGWDGGDYEIYYWDGSTTRNVSNNDTNDFYPSLYNGNIAWQGRDPSGADNEIFIWDGSTVTQFTQEGVYV